MRRGSMLALTCAGALLLVGPAGSAEPEPQSGLSDGEKELLRHDMLGGARLDLHERWKRIDTPVAAARWVYLENEPLAREVLDKLQALLPAAGDPEVALRLAALLYRYARDPGRERLLRSLREERSADAALILALNREEEALPDVVGVFDRERSSKELIYVLGAWDRATDEVLNHSLRWSQKNCLALGRALTLGEHEVEPDAGRRIELIHDSARSSSMSKLLAASILATWHPDDDHLVAELAAGLATDDVGSTKIAVIDALARSRGDLLQPYLVDRVETYLAAPTTVRATLAHCATVLARIDPEVGGPLGLSLLRRMAEAPLADPRLAHEVAAALCEKGVAESEPALVAAVGPGYCTRLRDLARLRPLPVRFLPESTRPLVPRCSVVDDDHDDCRVRPVPALALP